MKQIPLTKGKYALVDDGDYDWLNEYKWCFSGFYAKRGVWDGQTVHNVLMHRLIMKPPNGLDIDHINHNKLDNRKDNLRFATRRQNAANTLKLRRKSPQSSVFKGIYWHKRDRCWLTRIYVAGKRKEVGRFPHEIAAAMAYDIAAKDIYGSYAHLNFPHSQQLT